MPQPGEGCRDSSPEARFTLQSGRRRPALADRLETAYGRETKVLALTIPEREKILAALDDPAGRPRGASRSAAPRAGVAQIRRADLGRIRVAGEYTLCS